MSGNTVGTDLLSATNPENMTYTYDSNHMLVGKTDNKQQQFTYTHDAYKRLQTISVGGTVLRTFYYDTNPLDGSFSTYAQGRLTAVQHAQFSPGSAYTPNQIQFAEMYSYSQPGQPAKKRLQVTEKLAYSSGGGTQYVNRTLNLDAAYTYDNEGKMTSVNYPTTWSWDGSNLNSAAGPTYTYSFDSMSRPIGLTDQNNYAAVSGVQYGGTNSFNPNAMTSMSYFGVTETRQYNNLLQMTRVTVQGQLDMSYNFPTGTNVGKISSHTDNISGETVAYTYDSLNRLATSAGSGWTQNFGYDAFGNLVSKSGTNSPVLSIAANPATNQIVGQTYDLNGNQLSAPAFSGAPLVYDPENRLQSAPGVQYAFDCQNKRVWKGVFDGSGNVTGQELYFYGIDGQKLATYTLTINGTGAPQLADPPASVAVFFGGKRVAVNGSAFVPDRVGSNGKYFPYGEDRGTPLPNDQVKFATYIRDSVTSLDYADQRYYANNFGRFMTPDPYKAGKGSGDPRDPQSWNRYAYTEGDPVNRLDPEGTDWFPPGAFFSTLILIDEWDGENWTIKTGTILLFVQAQRPAKPAPPTPQSIKIHIYMTYGKAINDCIKSVFGKDAAKIPTQTISNAPVLNFTLSSAELAKIYGSPDPGNIIVGESNPRIGEHGTVYVASNIFKLLKGGDDGQLDLIDQTFVHELGNLLDEILNPNNTDPKYGRHYGDPSAADNDTGQQLENCVFK